MKVLNLQCGEQHLFEGWFASEPDFQLQLGQGLVTCPLCDDRHIQKMLTAPRLNLSGATAPDSLGRQPSGAGHSVAPLNVKGAKAQDEAVSAADEMGQSKPAQAAFLEALRTLLKNTEDVGDGFAEESRRMHYGDIPARNIRGQASARETSALLEEGINVVPLLVPAALKQTLQ